MGVWLSTTVYCWWEEGKAKRNPGILHVSYSLLLCPTENKPSISTDEIYTAALSQFEVALPQDC